MFGRAFWARLMYAMHTRSLPSGDVLSFGTDKDSLDAPLVDPVSDEPRRPVKAPHRVLPSLAFAIVGLCVFVGGLFMMGRPDADPCPGFEYTVCQYTGCFTAVQFFGAIFAIIGLPATVLPLGFLPQVMQP